MNLKKTLDSPGAIISFVMILILAGVLMVYSASRSLDFIQLTLPEDKKILGYCGIMALDGGLVFWLVTYLFGCRGNWQRGIAIMMIAVDFIGAVVMFNLDTVYNTGQAGLTVALSEQEVMYAVVALGIIISANMGAPILFHVMDPHAQRRAKRQGLIDKIHDKAMDLVDQQTPEMASLVAPALAQEMVKEDVGGVITTMGLGVDVNRLTAMFGDKNKNGVPDILDQISGQINVMVERAMLEAQERHAQLEPPKRPVGRPPSNGNGKANGKLDYSVLTLEDELPPT